MRPQQQQKLVFILALITFLSLFNLFQTHVKHGLGHSHSTEDLFSVLSFNDEKQVGLPREDHPSSSTETITGTSIDLNSDEGNNHMSTRQVDSYQKYHDKTESIGDVIEALPHWLDIKTVQFNITEEEQDAMRQLLNTSNLADRDFVHETPFTRHEGGVLVTKVLWPNANHLLKKSLCTAKAAYNQFVNYDFVIFTTLPWTMEQVEDLGRVVAPAKLIVATEGPTLEEHLASMKSDELKFLKERCINEHNPKNITWFHKCTEPGFNGGMNTLAYCWQAEFRAAHLWTHPALKDYKYMIWLDADAVCSKTWDKDPIDAMVKNNLTIMFTEFKGRTGSEELRTKMLKTYGKAPTCHNWIDEDGNYKSKQKCDHDKPVRFSQFGGFFHVTNLDVFRAERHQKFLKEFVGDYKFSRKWDDQLAVTIVPSMEDISRVWRLRSHDFKLMVNHHNVYDGVKQERVGRNKKDAWWREMIERNWTAGRLLCKYCF